ncbi:copper-binding protein [Erythrobacter sp. QSSC1-22B]|uniref:copper resistance protein B n=1 Tax=Erythrobacter sp. QSSC1-22B TaxID=1860125 RepID=UPI00080606C3|nr:copper resistance protein B [Erythrobacter sp. QSSC1-22B]OBX19748.1 copper-binding protein [Erythrobacter sp. QSSC1-22B]
MIRRAASLALGLALCGQPLAAQDHSDHSGHETPPAQAEPTDHSQHQAPPTTAPADPAPAQPAMDHSAHAMEPAPSAPPPPAAFEGPRHAADAIFGERAMAEARAQNHATHGEMKTGMVLIERLEARVAEGHDAYLWDLQGWYGGDIDRLVVKSEGEGAFGGPLGDAEVQALWSHAIGPYFDLQGGLRLDIEPELRSHLVLGVQGLAPYMWHVDGAVFVSDRGDFTARIEGEHDWKLTQRLILQPRAEFELAAQDIPERGIGAGLTKLEAGLRLRYEIRRELAPYVGVGYEAKLGQTADLARAAGEDPDGLALLIGLRAWF